MQPITDWDTVFRWQTTVIWGQPDAIAALPREIENRLPAGWARDRDAETRYLRMGGSAVESYCFRRDLGERGQVPLWLNKHSERRLMGGNVIPTDHANYHNLAAETVTQFRRELLDPLAAKLTLAVEDNRLGMRSVTTPDLMEALWRFQEKAGTTLPLAKDALPTWRQLVIVAKKADVAIDDDEFREWLVRRGWDREVAQRVVEKFFEDAWLLSAYDEARQPA